MLGARRLTAALLAVAVVCGLAACGDSGDDPVTDLDSADGDTGDDGATSTTVDPADVEADVVAAYEASWLNLLAAGDPPTADAPELAEHATGDALEGFRSTLASYAAEGIAFRGTIEFDARATQVGADTAVVEDCGLDRTELVVIATGEVAEDSDDARDGLVADLVLEDGAWKVSRLRDDPQVCE